MPNLEQYKDARALMAHRIAMRRAEDPTDRINRIQTVCKTCYYHTSDGHGGVCDYIGIVGHMRSCAGSECVKKGVYIKAPHAKKRHDLTIRGW